MSILQSAIEAELPFLRAEAEGRMQSRVTVRRKTGKASQNESTGLRGSTWEVAHTDLPFRLDGGSTGDGGSRTVMIAGVQYEDATAVGHLPAATEDLRDDDMLEVTSGEWPGTVWRVIKAVSADQKTARRLPIVSEQRPGEWT